MTEKANPSINRPAEAFKTAGAIALGGGQSSGYVSPSTSPSEISVQDGQIVEGNLNAFAETSSGSSFDVDIAGGEAFVYGSWVAIDTVTTVSLASSTNGQTVYVGWNKDGSDDVIVGLASAFDSASGNTDKKIPLWDFDTDASGVTSVTDRRTIGKSVDGRFIHNTNTVSSNYTTSGEQILFVDTSSSAITITLSTADLDQGSEVVIADSGSNAGTNSVTIDTEGSASINGVSSIAIDADDSAAALASDGTDWYTTGSGGGGGSLSSLSIDTDKDWQNYSISNIKSADVTNYVEPQVTASEGTSYNIDVSSANYHKVTMTGDVTFDVTNADASAVNSIMLHLVQDGTGGRTPSFTPTVVWDGGSTPNWSSGANEEDVITLVHDQDGSQWLGFVGGLGMA